MKKIFFTLILLGAFLFILNTGDAVAISCYQDQGFYEDETECLEYCPDRCENYSVYSCDGERCYCVDNCDQYGETCGYRTCQASEFPQWSCSGGGNTGICQYTCSYDEFCASGTTGNITGGWTTIENPLKYDTFQEILGAVSKFLFQIGLALAPIMFIIAGFMFVTAGGSPERVANAKKMTLYTVIGLAVILLASGLIAVLKSVIGYQG